MSRAALLALSALLLIASPKLAQALSIELTVAGNYEKADGIPAEYGLSTRARLNTFSGNRFQFGGSLFANLPGENLRIYDVIAGGGLRTAGMIYIDTGLGARYSNLWGPGFAIWGGVGAELSAKFYLLLPVIYRLGQSIEYTPYIGYRF